MRDKALKISTTIDKTKYKNKNTTPSELFPNLIGKS